MALIKIKNLNNKLVGELELSREGVKFKDGSDVGFINFVNKSISSGLPSGNKKKILIGDPFFALVFKNFLVREGFGVSEYDDDLDGKIKNFIKYISDDDPDKKEILSKLKHMSRLEMSLLALELENSK